MFSIFNANLTHDDDDSRPFPWRPLFAVILLLGMGLLVKGRLLPVYHAYQQDQREQSLAIAGLVAEAVETQLTDASTSVTDTLATLLPSVMTSETSAVALRLWDRQGVLTCEVTRDAPTPRPGPTSALPDLGTRAGIGLLQTRQQDSKWMAPILHMMTILLEEEDLLAQLREARDHPPTAAQRSAFYLLQDQNLRLADALQERQPLLRDATAAMEAVLDAVSQDDAAAGGRAVAAADDAVMAVTTALEAYRCRIDLLPRYPHELQAGTPPSSRWTGRLIPWLQARRVLVPLFTANTPEDLATPAGTLEVICAERPVDSLAARTVDLAVLALLLLAFVLTLTLRRRAA